MFYFLNITFTKVFRPFNQYFVEAPLTVITASSFLGYDAISLAHLYLGSFFHYSQQILSSSVRLDGDQGPFPPIAQCGQAASSRKSLGGSRLLPFKND
jgi:hypothetical protein